MVVMFIILVHFYTQFIIQPQTGITTRSPDQIQWIIRQTKFGVNYGYEIRKSVHFLNMDHTGFT